MATALDIVKRALRLIRVVDAGEAPGASDSSDALTTLNAMLAEWYESGMGLPDYSLAGLTTALASDNADTEAVAHQLAIRLAPEYAVAITPDLYRNATLSFARLRARYYQPRHPMTAEYY